MKDIEKILESMRPVDAPPELRRKILTQLASSETQTSFFEALLSDWGGWTIRVWLAIPCLLISLWIFSISFEGRNSGTAFYKNSTVSPVSFEELIREQKKLLSSINSEMEEIALPARRRNPSGREDACINQFLKYDII